MLRCSARRCAAGVRGRVPQLLTIEKLQARITGWVSVSDADVETEYRRRNEKVKLDLAVFTANQFRAGIQPTDAEIERSSTRTPNLPAAGEAAGPVPRRSTPRRCARR